MPAGSSIRACLKNCNLDTDPICDLSGQPSGVSAGTANLGPPLPLFVDNRTVPVCVVFVFLPGISGTANIQTGDITGSATVQAQVFLGACPECSGATASASGTCGGGATPGATCITDQITTATSHSGPVSYRVSKSCLPTGLGGTLQATITLTTGIMSQAQPCPGQSAMNEDECSGTCSATCTAAPTAGGVNQLCCSDDTTLPCFPQTVTRTGAVGVPSPAWPSTTYPKSSTETLVSALCAPGNPLIPTNAVGVPGPAALIFPSSIQWILGRADGCNTAADCADGNDCTQDVCTNDTCSHPLVAGLPGAQCLAKQAGGKTFCSGATIDPKLVKAVKKAISDANKALGKAASSSGKKRAKFLKTAAAAIKRARAAVAKAGKRRSKPLAAACVAEIDAALKALADAVSSS